MRLNELKTTAEKIFYEVPINIYVTYLFICSFLLQMNGAGVAMRKYCLQPMLFLKHVSRIR